MPELEDRLVARIADELRRPVRLDPDLDARVMAQVRSGPRRKQGTPWLLRRYTLSVTPLSSLALAAAVAVLVAGATVVARRGSPAGRPGAAA
ncbi:MAG TPA: hypothetical protein VD793_10910, partial [Gemmatimonadales bacterium]|nr:hypothetical protein [Gemmatimonadales bacterium]